MTTGYKAALDTNDLIMGYAKEATWGTKPAAPFQDIRLDGEGFSSQKSRTRPNEINASGQASAAITTKKEATGSLNFSVSAGTHKDLLAAAIGGRWQYPDYIPAANTVAITATTITDSANGFLTGLGVADATANFVIRLTCNGTKASELNNSTYLVSAAAAGVLTCTLISGPAMAVRTVTEVGYCKIEILTICKSSGATLAAAADGFTDSASGFVKKNFMVGQMVKVSGFATAGNNGYFRVNTIVAGKITTTPAPAGVEAAAAGASIAANCVRNGLNFDSFYFHKKLQDAAEAGGYLGLDYPGSFPTGGSLEVGVGDYLKGTLVFLLKAENSATAEVSTVGDHLPAPVGVVIDSISGIGTVKWKDSAIAASVQKIGLKFNKEGAAGQFAIGSADAAGVRKGTFTCDGTLTTYFKDFTLYADYVAAETTGRGTLSFPAVDGNGAGYMVTWCSATIMNPKVVCGGPGQDVMADFSIEGNPDTTGTYGYKTLQLDYFGAA